MTGDLPDLSPAAVAFGDQALAEIDDKGMAYALASLREGGVAPDELTGQERLILALGIRAGARAYHSWLLDRSAADGQAGR